MAFEKQRRKLIHKLLDLRRKRAVIAAWLLLVPRTGKSTFQFCLDNNIPPESYSRWVNSVQEPSWESIQVVTDALKKEGVL